LDNRFLKGEADNRIAHLTVQARDSPVTSVFAI
jgi:hypothetical protein